MRKPWAFIYSYLRRLCPNVLFLKTILHFGLFFLALSTVIGLLAFDVITPAFKRTVPARYAALEEKAPLEAAVLEQLLKHHHEKVDGLVVFAGNNDQLLSTIVVESPALGNNRYVADADAQDLIDLATSAGIPVTTEAAESSSLLDDANTGPRFFAVLLGAGFAGWFTTLMLRRRENKDEDSRLKSLVETISEAAYKLGRRTKIDSNALLGCLLGVLVAADAGLFLTGQFQVSELAAPAYIEKAERVTPEQLTRYLEKHAETVDRASVVPQMHEIWVKLKGVDDNPGVARRAIFKTARDLKAVLDGAKLTAKVERPTVRAGREMTTGGLASLAGLTLAALLVAFAFWYDWGNRRAEQFRESLAMVGVGRGSDATSERIQRRNERDSAKIRPTEVIRLTDVGGQDAAVKQLEIIARKLRFPYLYIHAFDAPVPTGVLFWGPPGVGKTLCVRALAHEFHLLAGVTPHVQIESGADFVQRYVGDGAAAVGRVAQLARKEARRRGVPSIIFIDEAETLCGKRKPSNDSGGEERAQTLNKLLAEMDGANESDRGLILWIFATNRPDMMDPAFLRPGRVDIKVPFVEPNLRARKQIWRIILTKRMHNLVLAGETEEEKRASFDSLIDYLAQLSIGFTGAKIAGAVRHAATAAVERNFGNREADIDASEVEAYRKMPIITSQDLENGCDVIALGQEVTLDERSPAERWLAAIHECGHAGRTGREHLTYVSILTTGTVNGGVLSSIGDGKRDWSREEMGEQIVKLLAGHAAQMLILNTATAGAHGDFDEACRLARLMVGKFGMADDFHGISLSLNDAGQLPLSASDWLCEKFERAWTALIKLHLEEAVEHVREHRARILACARLLYDRQRLNANDFWQEWDRDLPIYTPAAEDDKEPPRQLLLLPSTE